MKTVNHYHYYSPDPRLDQVLHLLQGLKTQGEKLMSQLDDAMTALQKIDAATTKQGETIQAEADSLQKVSTNLDSLIAQLGTTVPKNVLDGLKAAADHAQAISDSLDAQAAFSKALASKGPVNPVPTPVPPPTPTPTPTP